MLLLAIIIRSLLLLFFICSICKMNIKYLNVLYFHYVFYSLSLSLILADYLHKTVSHVRGEATRLISLNAVRKLLRCSCIFYFYPTWSYSKLPDCWSWHILSSAPCPIAIAVLYSLVLLLHCTLKMTMNGLNALQWMLLLIACLTTHDGYPLIASVTVVPSTACPSVEAY